MSTVLWIVIAVIVLAVIVLAVVLAMNRRPRLRSLPAADRARFAEDWRAVEIRFVDEPQQAVSEADRLVLAVYRERGGQEEQLPGGIREAREIVRRADGESMTENMRQAMQHYRSVMKDLLGGDPREEARRPEVAS